MFNEKVTAGELKRQKLNLAAKADGKCAAGARILRLLLNLSLHVFIPIILIKVKGEFFSLGMEALISAG